MIKKPKLSAAVYWIVFAVLFIVFIDYSLAALDMISQEMRLTYLSWSDLHVHFYIAALVIALLGLFVPNKMALIAMISILISPGLHEIDLFDGILHPFFIESGFYASLNAGHFSGNPQYSKLIFYFFFIALYPVLFLIKKPRNLNYVFIWLLLMANVTVVAIQHRIFPSGILRDFVAVESERIEKVRDLDLEKFTDACKLNQWNCRSRAASTIQEVHSVEMKEELNYFQSLARDFAQVKAKVRAVDTNTKPSIYIVTPLGDDKYYEIFESKKMKLFWSLNLGYLSKASFWVSFSWFYVLVLLAEIHKRVKLR